MKIVIVSASAPPEPGVDGRVNYDIAQYMARKGHEVWLISPYPSRPLSVSYEVCKYNRVITVEERFTHVNIVSFRYPKYNLLYRAFESYDFGRKAIKFINKNLNNSDLIYATPWPFLGQLIFIIKKRNKDIPIIMNIQDLYPESFFIKIKSNLIKRLLSPLYYIDRYIAHRSSFITVISETFKKVYIENRGVESKKIGIIYNWQNEEEFVKQIPSKVRILDQYNLTKIADRFIYMYLGNIGPVAGLESIITGFSYLKDNNVVLIIAGSGSYKEKCVMLANKLGLSNVIFTEVPPGLRSVVELQSISDILLLPILSQAANSSIPSKLIAYMFSKKPIITSANKDSETERAILESNSGWIIGSNESENWAKIFYSTCTMNEQDLQTKGESGYNYAIQNYSKKEGLIRIEQLFEKYD